jgi:hypothetical protein
MIATTIWGQLVKTLQKNPSLSVYVKQVFEGLRDSIEPESLPCIMLEPVKNNEIEKDFNQVKNIFLSVDLYAFSSNNFHEFSKTISGGADYKGILDIENDIRACLQSSYTLGDNAIDVRIGEVVFDSLSIGKYPVRGLMIPIKILYRQTDGI